MKFNGSAVDSDLDIIIDVLFSVCCDVLSF